MAIIKQSELEYLDDNTIREICLLNHNQLDKLPSNIFKLVEGDVNKFYRVVRLLERIIVRRFLIKTKIK